MSNITYTSEQTTSDSGKALEYFSKEKPSNLYVVGHSKFMKSLWKKYNLVGDEHKKEIMKENVWDLIFNYHNNNKKTNITFTRHAFSVANMYKERSSFKGNKPFIDQQLENDTKLSLYGILSALKISPIKNSTIKNGDTVYVSCLIRTWMTALCLYLPHLAKINNENTNNGNTNNKNTNNDNNPANIIKLTLKIADYIKEEGFTPDNTPESPQTQLKNIKVFIVFLKKIEPSLQNCTINIKIDFGTNIRNINNINNITNISNNYKLATIIKINNDNYYKTIYDIVNDNSKNIKSNIKNVTNKESKSLNKIPYAKTRRGFPKPSNEQIKLFSKWKEPFSKKGSSKMSRFSLIPNSKNKKNYLKKLTQGNTNDEHTNGKNINNINKQIKLYYTLNNQGKKDFFNEIPTNNVKKFYNKLKNEEKSKFNKFIKQSKNNSSYEGYTNNEEYTNNENNGRRRIYKRPNNINMPNMPNQ